MKDECGSTYSTSTRLIFMPPPLHLPTQQPPPPTNPFIHTVNLDVLSLVTLAYNCIPMLFQHNLYCPPHQYLSPPTPSTSSLVRSVPFTTSCFQTAYIYIISSVYFVINLYPSLSTTSTLLFLSCILPPDILLVLPALMVAYFQQDVFRSFPIYKVLQLRQFLFFSHQPKTVLLLNM